MKHPFEYEIIYSNRKTLAVQITPDGTVKVRAPRRCPNSTIDHFLQEKQSWILKYVSKAKQNPLSEKPPLPPSERNRYIKIARDIFTQKTAYYAGIMHVTYGRISIREQKTRWGSCSSEGNLNYNWRLIFAPEEVLDYIVVHELAHRREMNHSKAFYAVVESVLPEYKKAQKWLRDNGRSLWTVV
ncbi:MAG: M48 family metallopeptidase [Faecalicatena sp.]|uniref:M48 family metallopeptidase n=1 Tax=Faecalicatena sp. TaxID=2005360 RepID=UPI0025908598|nr:SprT family zinc-dependent metalloprotease [Faecalicatena sp.]MCI6467556.1 M48 family metallopeptidase [Faecalicatena sp.]MDY5619733.1 SprT family zinc-dependent metalloprotease [Lachnospiraceae bacterium]